MSKGPIVTFPGKAGDLLFAVPTMRALRHLYRAPLTLVVTRYCLPSLALVLEQPDLWSDEGAALNGSYRPTSDQPGMQPHVVGVPRELLADGHRDILHLGLTRFPHRGESIVQTIAAPWVPGRTKPGPWLVGGRTDKSGPVVMHAPERFTRWLVDRVPVEAKRRPVIVVGSPGEFVAHQAAGLDKIDGVTLRQTDDLCDVRDVAVGASEFVGVASAVAVAMAGLGYPCRWTMQPGSDARWIPLGCDVTIEGVADAGA